MKAHERFDKWAKSQYLTNAAIAQSLEKMTGLKIKHQHVRYWRTAGSPRSYLWEPIEKLTKGKIKAATWAK